MDDHDYDCLQTIGQHTSSMVPGLVLKVCVHRGHASKDARHRQNAVRLLAGGAGHNAHYALFSDDSRRLADNLLEAADVLAAPELGPVSPAAELRAIGAPPEVVAEAEHIRRFLMITATGVSVALIAHLAHDDAVQQDCDRSYVHVEMRQQGGPSLENLRLARSEVGPLASSLLEAAAEVSPGADTRLARFGLARCMEPVGIHADRHGKGIIAVTAHRAHDHPKAWHQAATISMHLDPGLRRKPVRVTMSAADVRELISGVLHKSVLLAGSLPSGGREVASEDARYERAGEMVTRQDSSTIRADVHFGHEDAGGEEHKETFVELFLQPRGIRPEDATDTSLTPPEVARLARTLARAVDLAEQQNPG